jgi:hypothetical protein
MKKKPKDAKSSKKMPPFMSDAKAAVMDKANTPPKKGEKGKAEPKKDMKKKKAMKSKKPRNIGRG